MPQSQSVNNLSYSSSSKRRQTVFIFDWDDTLLASTHLSARGCKLDTDFNSHPSYSDLTSGLTELESSVCNLLDTAVSLGEVHIVTNAELGWVELSAAKFLPAVVPILTRVKVISARTSYERVWPDAPMKWKFSAFHERLSHYQPHDSSLEKHIISLGDSHVEREAVRAVTRSMTNTKCKSVKFSERPTLEQLRRQLDLVTSCFAYIHQHHGDLDLQLTVTVNQAAQQPQSPSESPSAIQESEQNSSLQNSLNYCDEDLSSDSELGADFDNSECNRTYHSICQTA